MIGGSLRKSIGYLIGSIFGANEEFLDRNIVDLGRGGKYVASLGSSAGVRCGEELIIIHGKRRVRKVKKY